MAQEIKEIRKRERELALYGLYRQDINENEETSADIIENFTDEEALEKFKLTSGNYADLIIDTYNNKKDEVDDLIKKYLKAGWSIDRIAKIEKAILELSVVEMLFLEESLPKEIAINEAVELAKKYGGDESRKFVNGLLSNLIENEKK